MKLSTRLALAALATSLGVSAHALAQEWSVVLLEPAGVNQSKTFGASNGVQCGFVNYTGQGSATIWHGNPASVVDISAGQGWISSAANAISGDQVVVSALVGQTNGFLYSIAGNSFVNLSPPWSASTGMQGCAAGTNTQVGSGQLSMGVMLMWHGTQKSVVNLTPPGWISAAAAACAGDIQVGNGLSPSGFFGHPFISRGTPESYIDLTPPGSTSAAVAGCDPNSQVGGVFLPSSFFGHACLWHGTAESWIDLHPSFAASSSATACAGNTQIGNYVPSSGGFNGRAVVWHGSADSAQDLHHFVIEQLGSQYIQTEAVGIDPVTGDIVGNAYTQVGFFLIPHAIMWKPVLSCPCDITGDGDVTSQDFFDFLTAFFSGKADYNHDGSTTSQDFFDFLACFFAPPAGC